MATEKPAKPAPKPAAPSRFKVQEFTNPRTGSTSWRVSGIKRTGERVRANFGDLQSAQCQQIELETEYLRGHTETAIRATKLSPEKLQLAEVAYLKLGDEWQHILDCVDYWLKTGRQSPVESPRLDEAVKQFREWLDKSEYRERTQANLRLRVGIFANSVANLRVSEITPDTVFTYLEGRKVARASKDNDRRALSRFFGWCMERGTKEQPRRWITTNPARKETRERMPTNGTAPAILCLEQCERLLKTAQTHRGGRLAPYVALCLFGGLRPFEAARLTWDAVNLKDGEIRLEAKQTKTGRSRVVTIDKTLRAWLRAYEGKPFYPANWRKDFAVVKAAAGFGTPTEDKPNLKPWTEDLMRHTAISHFFRQTGSYGLTAERFGNSEAIIKNHYQGRVSSDDTKKFYALRPARKGGK